MILYKTVAREASAEIVIEKSRFIAHIKPAFSKEEADEFIGDMRADYKDATHNVPCFILGKNQELQWASDDGEPPMTSGMPMMQMLAREGITNVALVVTRYFGGTKLGTGGLVRAYTSAAKAVLEKAGTIEVKETCFLTVQMDYSHFPKLQNAEKEGKFTIVDTKYEDVVTVELETDIELANELKSTLGNLSAGGAKIVSEVLKNT